MAAVAVAEAVVVDRVGLAWRPELAAGILANLDRIECVEVMAEPCFDAPSTMLHALRRLAGTTHLVVHATSLGLASSHPVETRRIERVARIIDALRPAAWSEHLAFVRAGGIEIGHLAVPPRTPATIAGALANLDRIARIVGVAPSVENGATLIAPPASTLDEPEWTSAIVRGAHGGMLLDLHNLYANAVNFGGDPIALLRRMPLERVTMVHLAGGRMLPAPGGAQRLLDDHLHKVPDPVFVLLEALAGLVSQPLDVIIERDGRFPPFADLLAELDQARAALARGRAAIAKAA